MPRKGRKRGTENARRAAVHNQSFAKRRKPNGRKVKTHRSYQIDEAARVTGACKATVRRWIKTGLPTVHGCRPILILGDDLVQFMRKAPRRQKCQPAECYCLKCRVPRKPALGMADYIPMTSTGGNLRALCEACGNLMHKRITSTALTAIQAELDVTPVDRDRHLRDGH